MESFFGSPWDFGTGFTQPITQMPGSGMMPVAPQTDLTQIMAQGLAAKGIRPQQFFSNPSIAQDVLQPPSNAGTSPWDPTPVDMPRGAAVPPPGAAAPMAPTGDVAEAQAAGTPEEAAKGGKTTADKFLEGLKGVKMPVPPTAQKVSTPAAPHPDPRGQKAGELLALLLAAQGGGGGGVKLPPTLGASLQGMFR